MPAPLSLLSAAAAAAAAAASSSQKPKPQLLLLGTQKAATTSVWMLLHYNKLGLCGSTHWINSEAGSTKESHFFDLGEDKFPYDTLHQSYLSQFEATRQEYACDTDCECSFYGDFTPAYLYEGYAPHRMALMSAHNTAWHESVKIVAILREPVARDLAFYNHMRSQWVAHGGQNTVMGDIETYLCEKASDTAFPSYSAAVKCKIDDWRKNCKGMFIHDRSKAYHHCATYTGSENGSVEDVLKRTGFTVRRDQNYVNRLAHGMYQPQIETYVHKFSRHHLMIVDFDTMLANEADAIRRIVMHYGLPYDEHAASLQKLPKENDNPFEGKVKTISCDARAQLNNVFEGYNKDLLAYVRETQDKAPHHELPLPPDVHSFTSQVDCHPSGEEVFVAGGANFTTSVVVEDRRFWDDLAPEPDDGGGHVGSHDRDRVTTRQQESDTDSDSDSDRIHIAQPRPAASPGASAVTAALVPPS